jgi:hypothetical protein
MLSLPLALGVAAADANTLDRGRSLVWDKASVDGYDVQIKKGADGTAEDFYVDISTCDAKHCKLQFPNLDLNSDYYGRVRVAMDNGNKSEWTSWERYVVGDMVQGDTEAPRVNNLDYAFETNQPSASITGYAWDESHFDIMSKGAVDLDGQILNEGTGDFSDTVKLDEGTNLFEMYAEDVHGNGYSVWIRIEKDSVPPTFAVTDFPLQTAAQRVTINGTHEDMNYSMLTVKGDVDPEDFQHLGTQMDWVSYVDLVNEGVNSIILEDEDVFGNRSTQNISIYADWTDPTMSVVSSPGTSSNGEIPVTVNAQDNSPGLELIISGDASATVGVNNGDNGFIFGSAREGWNEYTLKVRDMVGRESAEETIYTWVDTQAPVLAQFNPGSSESMYVTLSGTVHDISGTDVTLYHNGIVVPTAFDGSVWNADVELAESGNLFEVQD